MPLVNTLKYLRLKNKLTRAFVSVESNICIRSIDYYEAGVIPIPLEFAERLAELFEYPVNLIVGKNQKIFITDEEHAAHFPAPTHKELLISRMNQFIMRQLPKRSLKDVHDEIKKRNDPV